MIDVIIPYRECNDTNVNEKVITLSRIVKIIEAKQDIPKCTKITILMAIGETISDGVDGVLQTVY